MRLSVGCVVQVKGTVAEEKRWKVSKRQQELQVVRDMLYNLKESVAYESEMKVQ